MEEFQLLLVSLVPTLPCIQLIALSPVHKNLAWDVDTSLLLCTSTRAFQHDARSESVINMTPISNALLNKSTVQPSVFIYAASLGLTDAIIHEGGADN